MGILELPAINNAKMKTKGMFCEIQLFLKMHHKINLNCDFFKVYNPPFQNVA